MAAALRATVARFAPIAAAAREVAILAYLDPRWHILGMRHMPGLGSGVPISMREILMDALAFDCAAVVMAHNHPSGDPSPSEADYAFTRRLARALEVIGVRLVDHVILAPNACDSFRERGLL